ncbi:MAG: hypothetical protein IJ642_12405 [Oscillospiraceae bacterium]|nr:hypothetical protein [Oscillospiraceae bacterium]
MLIAFLLSGCSCKHENWIEATCTEPKTCAKCGEIEGSSLGHTWKSADCLHPKICTVCGETEGETGDHVWKEADCLNPRTCEICGKTVGDPGEHDWKYATITEPSVCKVCGEEKLNLQDYSHVVDLKLHEMLETAEDQLYTSLRTEIKEHESLNVFVVYYSMSDDTAANVSMLRALDEESYNTFIDGFIGMGNSVKKMFTEPAPEYGIDSDSIVIEQLLCYPDEDHVLIMTVNDTIALDQFTENADQLKEIWE